jgi:hypothetical protein
MLGYHSIKKARLPKSSVFSVIRHYFLAFFFQKREIGGAQQALTIRFRQSCLTIISKTSETERKKTTLNTTIVKIKPQYGKVIVYFVLGLARRGWAIGAKPFFSLISELLITRSPFNIIWIISGASLLTVDNSLTSKVCPAASNNEIR